MKKINFLIKAALAFLFILIANISQSQTKVDLFTGWSGSTTTDHILWQPPYENGKGWYASIYTPKEMTNNGAILGNNILNSLRWNLQYDLQGAGATRTFTGVNIYLYHLTTSSFLNTSKPTIPVGAVKVFSGTLDFKIPNTSQTVCEIHVPFASNFIYDGTSSLVVYVEKITPDYQITNPYFALIDDPNHSSIRNVGSYKGNNTSDYDNTKKYIYPQIKFNDNATPTCFGGIVIPVAPPTGNSTQNFCSVDNPKISDIAVSGSDIKWYSQLIGGSPLSPSSILSNGVYYATQTVSGVESGRYSITVNIVNPSAPTTTSTIQFFCSSTNAQVKDIVVTSTSGSTIDWYFGSLTTPLISTDLLKNGKYYAAENISGCKSPNRLEIDVNILNPIAPTTSSASQNFCTTLNAKVSDLSAIASIGYAINWYNTPNGTTPLSINDLLSNGTYYVTQTKLGCESPGKLSVAVNIIDPTKPTTTSKVQSFCSTLNAKIGDLSVSSAGSINWYSTNTGNTALSNNTLLVDGNLYYATSSIGSPSCESTSRLEVEAKIILQSDPVIDNQQQSFCSSINPKVSDLSATTSIGSIKWYLDNTTTTALNGNEILHNGKYFASSIVSTCESSRIEMEVSIIDPSISAATNSKQSFCSSMNPSISDLIAYSSTGTTIKWYSSSSSSSELPITAKLVNENTYYAAAYNTTNLCESVSRLGIKISIISPSKPTTTNSQQSFCASENSKVSDLLATSTYGSSIKWYSTNSTTIPLFNNESLENGKTYYATEITTGSPSCESIDRLEISVAIHDLPIAPVGNSNQYFCKDMEPIVSNLSASGFSIKWYNTKDGNILYNGNEPLIDGNHYFSTQTKVEGCEGNLRLEVAVHFSNIKLESEFKKPFCNTYDGGISVNASGGIGKYSYIWDNGINASVIEKLENGFYRIDVMDSIGCVYTKNFELDCIKSQIPHVITPDENGKNDSWVLNLDPSAKLDIYNRWGSLVFTASPYMNDWNGQTSDGINTLGKGFLPGGTYFYVIDKKDGERPSSGYIELIR